MGERYVVTKGTVVSFEGLFDFKELITVLKEFFSDRKYSFGEEKRVESVKDDGRHSKIDYKAGMKYSDYTKIGMKVKVELEGVKDTVVELEGKQRKLQQGKVSVKIDSFVETDHEGHWEGKPLFVFIRALFDKYVYRHLTESHEKKLKGDVDALQKELEKFFNFYKT